MSEHERSSPLAREIRRHGAWVEGQTPDFDPAALRAEADREAATQVRPFVIPAHGSARRARWQFVAAAAAVVVVLVAAAVVARRTDVVDTVITPAPGSGLPAWEEMPSYSSPPGTELDASPDRPTVWTGSELLFVGALVSPMPSSDVIDPDPATKFAALAGVPSLNVETKTWRTISAPPAALIASDLRSVWTGSEVIVIGRSPTGDSSQATVFAYTPELDSWRAMTSAPAGSIGPMVWTGRWALTWSYREGVKRFNWLANSWDVLTNESDSAGGTPANAPGFNSSTARAVWTGDEMVVVSGDSPAASAFDPATLAWRRLPDPPFAAAPSPVGWTGEVVGISDGLRIGWLNPRHDATWQVHDQAPSMVPRRAPAEAWLPGRYEVWGGVGSEQRPGEVPSARLTVERNGFARELRGGDWKPTPSLPVGSIAFTGAVVGGDHVITWGIDADDQRVVGHGTIRVARIVTIAPSGAAGEPPGSAVTTTEPFVAPAGVAVEDLYTQGILGRGLYDTDTRLSFMPYTRADQGLTVIAKADAIAAAGTAITSFGGKATGSEPTSLGRFVERLPDGNFTSTPAWWISSIDARGAPVLPPCAPPRLPCAPLGYLATSRGGTVVVDAQTGAVLMIAIDQERGG